MTDRIITKTVLAVVGLALVAGCQTTPQSPATSPSDTTTPAASPSPSDTPTPTATPDPEPSATPEPEALPEAAAPTAAGDNAITSPADGATVAGPLVVISGTGTAFEATLLWRVIDAASQEVVVEDFTMAGSMGEIGPFEIEVELEPGVYQAEVWAPDMSDGEAGGPERIDLVAVTFVVE